MQFYNADGTGLRLFNGTRDIMTFDVSNDDGSLNVVGFYEVASTRGRRHPRHGLDGHDGLDQQGNLLRHLDCDARPACRASWRCKPPSPPMASSGPKMQNDTLDGKVAYQIGMLVLQLRRRTTRSNCFAPNSRSSARKTKSSRRRLPGATSDPVAAPIRVRRTGENN